MVLFLRPQCILTFKPGSAYSAPVLVLGVAVSQGLESSFHVSAAGSSCARGPAVMMPRSSS